MTPTMSEYFEAWKNSRFVAGDKATEKSFVGASRLQDIADILGGLELIYANVEPKIAEANQEQAEQTGQSLSQLEAFAARLRDQEAGGKKFTAEDADTLGRRGAGPAEAIAGQITQAAKQLNIELETLAVKVGWAIAGVVAALLSPRRRRTPPRPRGAAPERVQRALFSAQEDLILGTDAGAVRDVRRARAAYRGVAARASLRGEAPEADRALRRALGVAERAARRGDGRALAAARGEVRAAEFAGAYAVTLAAAGRGDAAAARSWLLLRDFRTATRFTRPGADATDAVARLARGKLAPAAARLAIAKDLLDAYQARQRELLKDADTAREKGFATGEAEAAAQAAGYWEILAPRYRQDRGAAAEQATTRAFAELRSAAESGDRQSATAARAEIDQALDGFTAAPFTAAESARRAQQLLRFVALVPVEYGRGVKDDRVTKDFEIQEAIAFGTAADAAFDDLRDQLAKRDPARTAAIGVEIDRLSAVATDAAEQEDRRRVPRRGREARQEDRGPARRRHAGQVAEAHRRLRLRPDRADARPHGGRGRRRPAPPGRAGAARGVRVLRVRPRAAAEVDRPGPGDRRRGPDLVRRQGPRRPRRADLQGRVPARAARHAARARPGARGRARRRSATARAARPWSPTRRSSSSARASRRC